MSGNQISYQYQVLASENGSPGAVNWYLTDNQGTVRDVARYASGVTSVVDHVIYDAYGAPTQGAGFLAVPLPRFASAGMRYDSASGLYYARARWYDPANGAFTSQDPSGFAAGDTNLFRYCGNSPTNATDPSGESFELFGEKLHMPWEEGAGGFSATLSAYGRIGARGAGSLCAGVGAVGLMSNGGSSGGGTPTRCGGIQNPLRAPDYASANINIAFPNPWTGTLVGVTGQASMDRFGNLYWGPGITVGKSATFASFSVTAGWLNQFGAPGQNQLQGFLSSNSFNFGGGFWGGMQETWTPGSGTATELGIFSPQVGGSWHYSWQKGNSGLQW